MERQKITIGITDCGRKFSQYENWIQRFDNRAEVIKLSYNLNNFSDAEKCDGFVLSGGQDVHPKFYKKPEYVELIDPKEVDQRRDEFELKVIDYSQRKQKPLLGICRGLQIANVYFGGTLIPDIFTHLQVDVHNNEDESDSLHPVFVEEQTVLHRIVETKSGEVNSSHHQSADKIGEGLRANAFSEDGIVEGLERVDAQNKSVLLLVQWHPERLPNQEGCFAKNVRSYFMREVARGNETLEARRRM
ncbi:MAG TPA: gamma-glutamyl-gamma-aminobutyrate hydrolase family protein [Chitinophagales bacterium]|nr:gamma-glutamyl-gamma-aminobutyrate hydrolase family protein [Chitinophagales bacterium]